MGGLEKDLQTLPELGEGCGDTQEVMPLGEECSEGPQPPSSMSSDLSLSPEASLASSPVPQGVHCPLILAGFCVCVCVCGWGPPLYSQIPQKRKAPLSLTQKHCALGGTALPECPGPFGVGFLGCRAKSRA